MTDHELSNLLKEWKRTPAPPTLSARVFRPRPLPPPSWWDIIPTPLTAAAGAVAGGLGVWLLVMLLPSTAPPTPVPPQSAGQNTQQVAPEIAPELAPLVSVRPAKPPVAPAVRGPSTPKEVGPQVSTLPRPSRAKPVAAQPPASLTSASPRLLNGPDPPYPADAPLLTAPVTVKVRIHIGPDGRVIDAEVIKGDPLLSSIALDAVKTWLYEPGAETTTEIDVVFGPKKKK